MDGENKKVFVLFMEPRSPWAVSDIRSVLNILLTKKLLHRHAFYLVPATAATSSIT